MLPDCNDCRENTDEAIRQSMGCGFLAPVEDAAPWDANGKIQPTPTTCPRYTTELPDVIDIARAWVWWEKGQLREVAPNAPQPLKDGVEVFAAAVQELTQRKASNKP